MGQQIVCPGCYEKLTTDEMCETCNVIAKLRDEVKVLKVRMNEAQVGEKFWREQTNNVIVLRDLLVKKIIDLDKQVVELRSKDEQPTNRAAAPES